MEVGVKMNKKKIILYILIIILVIGILVGFIYTNKKDDKTKENKVTDAIKIKEEYESLNDKQASNGNIYPKVTLKENNTFRYASAKKVLETLKSGTGLIYLGFKECPWCRNAINVLQYVNANEILYLDMTNQRDKYEEKVIGVTTRDSHIVTWDFENQICKIPVDGMVFFGGTECTGDVDNGKIVDFKIVSIGLSK